MKKVCLFLMVVIGISAAVYGQTTVNPSSLYVFFSADNADLTKVSPELAIQNSQVFTKLAQDLLDNPKHRLLIDGRANAVLGTEEEEIKVLKPLSLDRATAAKDFLIKYYGINRDQLIISGGSGSTYPVSTNPSESYKNRCAVFFIINP
jgi:outer membrane protein OmpA-like peptidoglycan-associated protein